jgi:Zn-dependent protease
MDQIGPIVQRIAISAIPVLFAIVLHEVAHGWVANRFGDPTARLSGRLTINPLAHIDLFGTIIIPLVLLITTSGRFVFGYAKPVPVNFLNLRRPKEDMVLVAAAGPATNLILATFCGVLFRLMVQLYPELLLYIQMGGHPSYRPGPAAMVFFPVLLMLMEGVKWNVLLAIFNMIPIPPLDGGRVMVGLLPERQSAMWSSLEPFGFFIVIFLVFLDPLGVWSQVVSPLMMGLTTFFLGLNPFLFM